MLNITKQTLIKISIKTKEEILKGLKLQLSFLNMSGNYTNFNLVSIQELKTVSELNTLYSLLNNVRGI